MEENFRPKQESDFVFSKAVKAGKRIYYFDVRRTRNSNDMYVAITESKKNLSGTAENPTFTFTKQKVLLYKEDFKNFADALHEVIDFIEQAKKEEKPVEKRQYKPEQKRTEQPEFRHGHEQKPKKSSFFDKLFGSSNKKPQQKEENIDKYFEDIKFEV
ncbi:MAG: PUR family DNA/RNA-binding protein [Prevotellaceae bacterium]|jgi:antitoxin component HigA of HigAB toxin-antitoxin module|nr:PUR family DNA/RNA-binding protein [Prevotellaceae bacterium]